MVGGGGRVSVTCAAVPRDGVTRAAGRGSSITSWAGRVVVVVVVEVVEVVVASLGGAAGSSVGDDAVVAVGSLVGTGSLVGGGPVVVVGSVPASAVEAAATTSVAAATESVTIRPNFDRIGSRLPGRSPVVE